MSDQDLPEMPEWLNDRQAVPNDENISAIDLQVVYHEGQFPNLESPLAWAEEMLRASKIMVEAYEKYVKELQDGESGKTL